MGGHGFSIRLLAAYALDWLVLVAFAIVAYVFSSLTPHAHAFSLLDLSISYPLIPDTVSIVVAGIVAGAVPALLMCIIILFAVPGPAAGKLLVKGRLLPLKLWECHTAWLGLAMSLASALMITQGLKNFGKPRPNCLARCQPDLNAIQSHIVGGFGQDISPLWTTVTRDICQQKDLKVLNDGFQSWPSGHTTVSWAGLFYLFLFLAAKFAAHLPYSPISPRTDPQHADSTQVNENLNSNTSQERSPTAYNRRSSSAAPPTYLLIIVLLPLAAAFYISLSRYMDYAHHGFDILSGAIVGVTTAYVSFRWYNPPIASGCGFAWGARSPSRAFGIGVGTNGFVEDSKTGQNSNMELN